MWRSVKKDIHTIPIKKIVTPKLRVLKAFSIRSAYFLSANDTLPPCPRKN
jgi:hypothetical protein